MVLSEQVWKVEGTRFCAEASHCGSLVGIGAPETCLKVVSAFHI